MKPLSISPSPVAEFLHETTYRRIAVLMIQGVYAKTEIARRLKLSRATIRRRMAEPRFAQVMRDVQEQYVAAQLEAMARERRAECRQFRAAQSAELEKRIEARRQRDRERYRRRQERRAHGECGQQASHIPAYRSDA